IDKIAGRQQASHGPDVSREGVQRDLLPIVEGTTVNTKYGMVKTDHILFIAAGAFHVAKPSDLIPEMQGRFPIRVELESLTEDDFVRILREPKNALTMQYTALLSTEGVELQFADDAIREVARYAALVNQKTENIGAPRLPTTFGSRSNRTRPTRCSRSWINAPRSSRSAIQIGRTCSPPRAMCGSRSGSTRCGALSIRRLSAASSFPVVCSKDVSSCIA